MKSKSTREEAKEHLREIKRGRDQIYKVMGHIYLHRHKLNEIICDDFNSRAIDGQTIGESQIGSKACTESPIGVCVYCTEREEAMSLPGQREYEADSKTGKSYRVLDTPATKLDACLFCGIPDYHRHDDHDDVDRLVEGSL